MITRVFVSAEITNKERVAAAQENILIQAGSDSSKLKKVEKLGRRAATTIGTDPAIRAIISRYLAAYPAELPNRTDINPRALNTNSLHSIDNDRAVIRLDQYSGDSDRITLFYSFLKQHVDAFQLVAGQNPDTDTRNHRARVTWSRTLSPRTILETSLGFDRIGFRISFISSPWTARDANRRPEAQAGAKANGILPEQAARTGTKESIPPCC
jgi:hypothetical protein